MEVYDLVILLNTFAYLPYFDYLEKHDYFVPGGILRTDTIFDWCVENNVMLILVNPPSYKESQKYINNYVSQSNFLRV